MILYREQTSYNDLLDVLKLSLKGFELNSDKIKKILSSSFNHGFCFRFMVFQKGDNLNLEYCISVK
jgi:hypothetical protein